MCICIWKNEVNTDAKIMFSQQLVSVGSLEGGGLIVDEPKKNHIYISIKFLEGHNNFLCLIAELLSYQTKIDILTISCTCRVIMLSDKQRQ